MGISLDTAHTQLIDRQAEFKMNELGDEPAITIGRDNQITKAEIMEPPKRPQRDTKPYGANKGLEGVFKATIDKCDWWHSAGKLRRAQDAIEVNLGRVAGKFVNLQTLAGKPGDLENIEHEKILLIDGIKKELSAFKTEINSLVRSYGLNSDNSESLFLQRLINSLEKENPHALNSLKAAVAVIARMPADPPVMGVHDNLVKKFDTMLHDSIENVVAAPKDERKTLQKLADVFKGLFSTKEKSIKLKLRDELSGLEELCNTGGPEMEEFTNKIETLKKGIKDDTELTTKDFELVRNELDTIIGETIKRGKEIAEKALEMESVKMAGQLAVDKYQPQLVSPKEVNRDLTKLFLYKNATMDQAKSLQNPLDGKVDDIIRNHIRSQNKSLEEPKGARVVVQIAVNSVNDMTHKFVAAQLEIKSLEEKLSAITLAKQLAAKGDDTPPAGVDAKDWRKACSVATEHLLKTTRSVISEEDNAALNLIKTNRPHFTEGLEGDAVERLGKLFTQLDVSTQFTVQVPKPSLEQIEQLKQTGETLIEKNSEQFKVHMQEWLSSAPKTGIPALDSRLVTLRTPIKLNTGKLDETSLRQTLSNVEWRISPIKEAYSYEMALELSGIDNKEARLDRRMEMLADLNTELQGLMRLEADLHGMINICAMGSMASEGLDLLRQYCPKERDREAWESNCNAIVNFIIEHPHDIPDKETVAVFDRLLSTFNKSLTKNIDDTPKVALYDELKQTLNIWKDWGFTVGTGLDSLNNTKHMNDVLEGVSKMTTARIRISDTVNLMQDSFIALTKAGLPHTHADELRSNLSEYTQKLMVFADAMSKIDKKTESVRPLILQEAQESLSKAIHSFFPAMEFLAEQEYLYMDNPTDFPLDKMQQLTDLRATLFNAYATVFDIARNVDTLGPDISDVSTVLENIYQTEISVLSREGAAVKEINTMFTYGKMSRTVDSNNPSSLPRVTGNMMLESEALMKFNFHMNNDKQITKLFTNTRRLTTALVEAKARGLDPALARSIEQLFSEHVLSPAEGLQLDRFIPDQKKHDNFIANFNELHGAMMQSCSVLQSFKLNVKSTQTRINREAQDYLKGCMKIQQGYHPIENKSLQKDLRVVASHDIGGKMSRILIESSSKEEPRWYDVSLNKDTVTFTPTDDKSGSGVLTAPVSNGGIRFPKV